MAELYCPDCKKVIGMNKFLKHVEAFDRGTISGVSKCPHCRKSIQFQVRNNRMTVGYTYFSGSLHFEGLYDVDARGLKCVRDKDGVHYIYKGVFYNVPLKKEEE
jgi:hypothetical protein